MGKFAEWRIKGSKNKVKEIKLKQITDIVADKEWFYKGEVYNLWKKILQEIANQLKEGWYNTSLRTPFGILKMGEIQPREVITPVWKIKINRNLKYRLYWKKIKNHWKKGEE